MFLVPLKVLFTIAPLTGMRFGLVESKVGLIALLKDHEFSVNQNTPEPLKMHPLSFITSASDTIWLDVKRIE